ncbi:hypothetical protein G9A89_012405 [Geosiphon pyriformis]|nr:hypothetical protein G9A89_012405 [Geosiphon pyriformis]
MKYLCVAEKPSVAKSVAHILANCLAHTTPQTGSSENQYIKNYTFSFQDNSGNRNEVTVTAVLGHLTSIDFTSGHGWSDCNPIALFDAPIETKILEAMIGVAQNLKNKVWSANCLMIWTDCDREGENIGKEVVEVCRQRNPRIIIKRARFSAIESRAILNAWLTSVNSSQEQLDMHQSDAVEARMELDLRVGAAFTRYQTLGFQKEFQRLDSEGVISFGPCQIPTLGFVVDRWEQRENFTVEKYWYIEVIIKHQNKEVNFRWVKEQYQNEIQINEANNNQKTKTEYNCYVELFVDAYIVMLSGKDAIIDMVKSVPKSKWKPRPLTTVELLKLAARFLRLNSQSAMISAERLYNQGFITYPRTDTDQFPPNTDFKGIIGELKGGAEAELNRGQNNSTDQGAFDWIPFAESLLNDKFRTPRNGQKNDGAHPPIHPIRYPSSYLQHREDQDLYNFILKYFLASCADDAKGQETIVEIKVEEETFRATGLVILERNWLEVYPYEKWGERDIPNFRDGQIYKDPIVLKKEGRTTAPELLTEADLITCLYENGIGTDATISEHISKIFIRNYADKLREGQKEYIYPLELGLALIHGYREIGYESSLSKPFLRRKLEEELQQICDNQKTKGEVVATFVDKYRNMYSMTVQEEAKIIQAFMRHFGPPVCSDPDGSYIVGSRKIERRRSLINPFNIKLYFVFDITIRHFDILINAPNNVNGSMNVQNSCYGLELVMAQVDHIPKHVKIAEAQGGYLQAAEPAAGASVGELLEDQGRILMNGNSVFY